MQSTAAAGLTPRGPCIRPAHRFTLTFRDHPQSPRPLILVIDWRRGADLVTSSNATPKLALLHSPALIVHAVPSAMPHLRQPTDKRFTFIGAAHVPRYDERARHRADYAR